MPTDIELGGPRWDGLGVGRPYSGNGFVDSIYAPLEGPLYVTYGHRGDKPSATVDMGVTDPDRAVGAVLEEDAAMTAITDILRDLRQRERGVVFGGTHMLPGIAVDAGELPDVSPAQG
jgi:hypothetical protein